MSDTEHDPTTVLLVDDESNFLHGTGVALRLAGFKVETSTDAAGLLGRLASSNYGALVLDIMMPGHRGTDLLTEIVRRAKLVLLMRTLRMVNVNAVVLKWSAGRCVSGCLRSLITLIVC